MQYIVLTLIALNLEVESHFDILIDEPFNSVKSSLKKNWNTWIIARNKHKRFVPFTLE